jgi:hypothetical protein
MARAYSVRFFDIDGVNCTTLDSGFAVIMAVGVGRDSSTVCDKTAAQVHVHGTSHCPARDVSLGCCQFGFFV